MNIISKLFLLVVVFFFICCSAVKNTQTKHTDIHHYRVDSVFVDRIRAVNDTVFIPVVEYVSPNKNCDSVVKAQRENLLKSIHYKRQSEQLDIGFFYDSIKKHIVAYSKLKQSYELLKNSHLVHKKTEQSTVKEQSISSYKLLFVGFLLGVLAVCLPMIFKR